MDDHPTDAVTGQPHVFTTVQQSPGRTEVPPRPVRSESRDFPREQTTTSYQGTVQQQQPPMQQQQQTTQPTPTQPALPARPAVKRVPTAVITRPGEPESVDTTTQGPVPAQAGTIHVPNSQDQTGRAESTSVVPATEAHTAPDHALPTAPNVHPQAQAARLESAARDDPGLIAAEVEKAKAGRREVQGKEEKGTVVQGIEDDRLWALLRKFDEVSSGSTREE
jgi:hypothetical protein